ncbi:MAG TPA: 4-(cytidine 5'-diphospho)-2-C-methyl-D-erythritol kinase [Xanthomonadales bacterium]|nr:4-(cytidine 5'-diphospho)-2-C-methyl-D-erythritol kinase [Xanthomonadales bacterium]
MPFLLLRPPAKLNRFLHIVGRRADGYHLLQTAFELIDWTDELAIENRDDGVIERRGGAIGVAAESDLVVRAARLLQPLAATGAGCTLTLTKHIPTGAGLGGGSADAAAVLLGLNRLWRLDLSVERLLQLGLQLGADVPVFIGQHPAFAQGVGEVLSPVPFAARSYAVIYPAVALATGPMFADPRLRRDCPPISVADYLAGAPTGNVFEPVALSRSVEIAAAADWLRARLGEAHLTGSGSAVFAQAAELQAAQAALAGAPAHWTCRAARSITNWFDNDQARA